MSISTRHILFFLGLLPSMSAVLAEPSAIKQPTLIAVGNVNKQAEYPERAHVKSMLLLSQDLGANWKVPEIIDLRATNDSNSDASAASNFPDDMLIAVSCTVGSGATCYALESVFQKPQAQFMVSSPDRNTWKAKPMPNGWPQALSCAGDDPANTTCAVVNSQGRELSLAITHDGGEHWMEQTLNGEKASTGDVSCTGHGEGTRCVFVGGTALYSLDSFLKVIPTIFVNSHQETFWEPKWIGPDDEMEQSGALQKVSCAGEGDAAVCAAIGSEDSFSGNSVMWATNDGGQTWYVPDTAIKNLSNKKQLGGVSCVKNDVANFCVAAGTKTKASFTESKAKPFFLSSIDSGQWFMTTPNYLKKYRGLIEDLSCTANQVTSLCVAVGLRDPETKKPVMLVSTDKGSSWVVKPAANLTKDYHLNKISCHSDQNSAVCVASGFSFDTDVNESMRMISSYDYGSTWVSPTASQQQSGAQIEGIAIAY